MGGHDRSIMGGAENGGLAERESLVGIVDDLIGVQGEGPSVPTVALAFSDEVSPLFELFGCGGHRSPATVDALC